MRCRMSAPFSGKAVVIGRSQRQRRSPGRRENLPPGRESVTGECPRHRRTSSRIRDEGSICRDRVSCNVHLPATASGERTAKLCRRRKATPPTPVSLLYSSEPGAFTAWPPETLSCHRPRARHVLSAAAINPNAADKSNSARTPPTECVSWSSSNCPVRTKRVATGVPHQASSHLPSRAQTGWRPAGAGPTSFVPKYSPWSCLE